MLNWTFSQSQASMTKNRVVILGSWVTLFFFALNLFSMHSNANHMLIILDL